MEEEPGMGAGNDSSKYTYYVETLADGNRVYLTRPAFLNKGFDFVIRVEMRTMVIKVHIKCTNTQRY